MKNARYATLLVAALWLAANTAKAAPVPAGEWLFNETGTLANSTGSNTALDLTLRNQTGAVADMHSADGSGLTGLPGDRAFDNRAATNMGTGASGRADISDSASNTLDGLSTFTLAGWFRRDPAATSTNTGWLFNDYLYAPGIGFTGYGLYYNSGKLGMTVGHYLGYDSAQSSAGAYADSDSWVFFAAVYKGTGTCPLNCPYVSFYKGTLNSPVVLINTVSGSGVLQGGASYPDVQYFTLGSASYSTGASIVTGGPFDGLLDNMRIYGSALSLADIEAMQAADIPAAVPLPGTLWLFGTGAAGVMCLARARKVKGS
jgi:hypothetical protein